MRENISVLHRGAEEVEGTSASLFLSITTTADRAGVSCEGRNRPDFSILN